MRQIGLLTIVYKQQRGFLFRPEVLNRVAPLFFGPRLSRAIQLKDAGLNGRVLHIPLGCENWENLRPQIREEFGQRVQSLCRKQGIESLGITRGLSLESLGSLALQSRSGDKFITALALLKIEEVLGQTGGQRVILVSDQKLAFKLAVKVSERFKLPVFLQCANPSRHEATALRILHQEGLAISLGVLKPAKWKDDDIILLLDDSYADLVSSTATGRQLTLAESSHGHAPQLEESLQRQGVDPALRNLAPLMEAFLLDGTSANRQDLVRTIEEEGGQVWDYFLDKEGVAHYNTIKGF
jgi:hypothetical protein